MRTKNEKGVINIIKNDTKSLQDRITKTANKLLKAGMIEGLTAIECLYLRNELLIVVEVEMTKIYDLKEAREWFLKHSEGSVICVDGRNAQLEVDCYPDAEEFFNRN